MGRLVPSRPLHWSLGFVEATRWFFGVFAYRPDSHPLDSAALAHLQDLVSEPVQPWDALICSSTQEDLLLKLCFAVGEEALAKRSGGDAERLRALTPAPCYPPTAAR